MTHSQAIYKYDNIQERGREERERRKGIVAREVGGGLEVMANEGCGKVKVGRDLEAVANEVK